MAQVSAGHSFYSYRSNFGPVNPVTGDTLEWDTDPLVRTYLSTDSADLADWPLRAPDGSVQVRSAEDGYAVYSDVNPDYMPSGQQPIGVLVRQWSYGWNFGDYADIVFFRFRVINVSDHPLSNVYVGPAVDSDVGYGWGDDFCELDFGRSLALQYSSYVPSGGSRVGVFGCRMLETPRNNTGQVAHVVDDRYGHDIPPGEELGLTAFQTFDWVLPETPPQCYLSLQGINFQTMNPDAYDDSGTAYPADKKFLMASGPCFLARGDSCAISIAVMCAWDTSALRRLSDVAQWIYDSDFEMAITPAPPEITTIPEDRAVRISWTRKSETTPDSYWAMMDPTPRWYTYFRGSYRTMYPGRWQYPVDTAKVDSFRIKTGTLTTAAIARGAANPSGGTDTTEAFYSRREMYEPYDFQCYTVYRAMTKAGLDDPAARTAVGGLFRDQATGISSYAFDKKDGIKVVLDLATNIYAAVDTDYVMPKYDTLGSDRGLVYSVVDDDVANNFGHWYGISATDYQPNAYFTHQSPTTLASKPSKSASYCAAQPPSSDYRPGTVRYAVTRGTDDVRSLDGCGTVDYANKLFVGNASDIRDARYDLLWSVGKEGGDNGVPQCPVYTAVIYGEPGTQVQGFASLLSAGQPAPPGWTLVGVDGDTGTGNYGGASPAIRFDGNGDTAVSPQFLSPMGLSYWIKGVGTDANSALLVQGYTGDGWTTLDSVAPPAAAGITRQTAIASPISLVRFVYRKSAGDLVIDDVSIRGQFVVGTSRVRTTYGRYAAGDTIRSFYGTSDDESTFGGVIYQPKVVFRPGKAKVDRDSLQIFEVAGGARTYPRDSCFVALDANTWKPTMAMWMWRGADFEVRWKDTTVRVGPATQDSACLTCTVWDVTNGLQVPWVGAGTKATMTVPGWSFNPAALNGTLPYLYNRSDCIDNVGMFISGLTLYFNRRKTSPLTANQMIWAQRPESGDVWRINCAGPRTPVDSNAIAITTTAPGWTASPSAGLLDRIRVVPNPFLVRADWDLSPDHPFLCFTNLPSRCVIRIYNMAGDLVSVLNHATRGAVGNSSEKWNLLTPYSKRVASGMYVFHVDAPGIGTKTGTFAVIR